MTGPHGYRRPVTAENAAVLFLETDLAPGVQSILAMHIAA